MDVLFCFGAARRIPQLEQRTRSANLSCLPARPCYMGAARKRATPAESISKQAASRWPERERYAPWRAIAGHGAQKRPWLTH